MNDTEKFLFDLQGFIVVREFLSQGEVKALNDAFDANWDQRREDPIGDPSGNMAGLHKRSILTGMLTYGSSPTASPSATCSRTASSCPTSTPCTDAAGSSTTSRS